MKRFDLFDLCMALAMLGIFIAGMAMLAAQNGALDPETATAVVLGGFFGSPILALCAALSA